MNTLSYYLNTEQGSLRTAIRRPRRTTGACHDYSDGHCVRPTVAEPSGGYSARSGRLSFRSELSGNQPYRFCRHRPGNPTARPDQLRTLPPRTAQPLGRAGPVMPGYPKIPDTASDVRAATTDV